MDQRAAALKLVLDRLETTDISNVERRMEVQKAIYLAQKAGISLGYSYGWYIRGPYSPALTRDYYDIGDEVPVGMNLKATAIEKLDRVRAIMGDRHPALSQPKWLELLASLLYLLTESKMSEATARKKLAEYKPHLSEYVPAGIDALKARGFVEG